MEIPRWVEDAFERLGIADRIDSPVGHMSVGQQQRVAIIRAMAQPTDFILLDEPVSHLDSHSNDCAASFIEEEASSKRRNNSDIGRQSAGARLHFNHTPMTTDRRILGQLLRRNISIGQLAAFAASSLIGLMIISTAVRFYTDITAPSASDGATDFLVISHGVKGLGSLTDGTDGFSADEIGKLRRQPWVKRLGTFTTAGFSVSAGIDIGPAAACRQPCFSNRSPTSLSMPIPRSGITPRSVGNGADRDQQRLSRTLQLRIRSFKRTAPDKRYDERSAAYKPHRIGQRTSPHIQGAHSRVFQPTQYHRRATVVHGLANGIYADAAAPRTPSRIMVETTNPGDPAIKTYLSDNGYELGGDKAFGGRASQIAGVLTAIVIGVGIVIVLLSFGLLLLSVWLLLYKNRYTTTLLMLEGYSAKHRSAATTYA